MVEDHLERNSMIWLVGLGVAAMQSHVSLYLHVYMGKLKGSLRFRSGFRVVRQEKDLNFARLLQPAAFDIRRLRRTLNQIGGWLSSAALQIVQTSILVRKLHNFVVQSVIQQ